VLFSFQFSFHTIMNPYAPAWTPQTKKSTLNPFAPEWIPNTPSNSKIQELVTLAASPEIWAKHRIYQMDTNYTHLTADLTKEEILAAVRRHPGVLQFLSEEQKTSDVCWAALATAPKQAVKDYDCNGENFPLFYVPLEHRTEALCLVAATWCNRALWYWPPALRTRRMYEKVAKLNPSTITTTMPEPFATQLAKKHRLPKPATLPPSLRYAIKKLPASK
jgi:hypothetical protein